jgi:hypothetical protein
MSLIGACAVSFVCRPLSLFCFHSNGCCNQCAWSRKHRKLPRPTESSPHKVPPITLPFLLLILDSISLTHIRECIVPMDSANWTWRWDILESCKRYWLKICDWNTWRWHNFVFFGELLYNVFASSETQCPVWPCSYLLTLKNFCFLWINRPLHTIAF